MKRFLLLVSSIALSSSLFAQGVIPNGGFETWGSVANAYQAPTSWTTINNYQPTFSDSVVLQDFNYHLGNYSARLTTKKIDPPYDAIVIAGFMGTSVVPSFSPLTTPPVTFSGGYPFVDRPDSITGWYTYAPVGADTFVVSVLLTKWNALAIPPKRDTVGTCNIMRSAAVTTWTMFADTIRYASYGYPDTCLILVQSSKASPAPLNLGTFMRVDDFKFAGVDTNTTVPGTFVKEANKKSEIVLFPNPAKNEINISAASASGIMTITNILGQEVMQIRVDKSTVKADVSRLDKGLYLYRFVSNGGTETKTGRLVIDK